LNGLIFFHSFNAKEKPLSISSCINIVLKNQVVRVLLDFKYAE